MKIQPSVVNRKGINRKGIELRPVALTFSFSCSGSETVAMKGNALGWVWMLVLVLVGTAAPVAAANQPVTFYVEGLFDEPNPSPTELARLRRLATRVANSGASTLIPCFIHIGQEGVLIYNNEEIVSDKGTINPGFNHLPQVSCRLDKVHCARHPTEYWL